VKSPKQLRKNNDDAFSQKKKKKKKNKKTARIVRMKLTCLL